MNEKTRNHHLRIAPSQEAKESASAIIVQTLSGYEIWLDHTSEEMEWDSAGGIIFRFAVTTHQREFQLIRVEIPAAIQDEVRHAVGPRFSDDDRFWFALAHNALSDDLEEGPEAFAAGHIVIDHLSPGQFDLAMRWGKSWNDL